MRNYLQNLIQNGLQLFDRGITAGITIIVILITSVQLPAQVLPAGFNTVKVATVHYPTSMAMAPDGRIFVTEKAGKVKIIKNGVILSTPFLTVNVDQLNERGLSSVCLDPNFSVNKYVYIFYTTQASPIHNRLSRFTANGDLAVSGSEVIITDFEPLLNGIHNGGGMAFGPDGKLYLAIGNDNVNSYSQDLTNYKGKVLRINADGSVPSGNPYTTPEAAKKIWAYGLRNPWTIDIQPGTGRIFVNDVGGSRWEEINDATIAGRNFGWPATEGYTTNPSYNTPLYAYPHGTGNSSGCAITGGVFFNPTSTNYPAMYAGKYFFIDYCNNWINYLDLSGGTPQKFTFATGLPSSLNYLKVGNDGNLYYFSIGQTSLYKITYTNNNAPVITSHPTSATVSEGQNVTFTVSASGASPLAFQWKKNGTNITGATGASYTITSVTASDSGQYTASATNSYGSALSNPATLIVTAFNSKPEAIIDAPAAGTLYRGGDVINFSGNATDSEDGTLPASAFNWYLEFRHDAHTHPGPFIPPGVKTGSFSISQTSEMSANVYYRLFLYVTDSNGSKDTAFVDIIPKKAVLNLATQPSGLQILLDGQPHVTPDSVEAVSGMIRSLSAPPTQSSGENNYNFSHWLHGGDADQNITTTDNNTTFTAVYTPGAASVCAATGEITRDYWAGYTGTTVAGVPVNTPPTGTGNITIFEGPSNVADNYGSRIRGYVCPPTTGNYTFWIASDNASELWLSTDSNAFNKVKIAASPSYTMQREWTKYPAQQSSQIYLIAGRRYYIEAIHREGTQGDNLAVGWQLPNGSYERPIPGSRLSPFTTATGTAPVVSITSPADGTTFSNPSNITINANASTSSGSIVKVEFYSGTNKIGEDLSAPYSFTWMNVSTGNYALKAIATNNTGQTGTSATVNITVAACSTPIITATGPTTMCSGTVTLKTTYIAGNGYQWKKNGVDIAGATSYTYTASSSGDYQVKVIQGSCISWSAPTKVSIGSGLKAVITAGGPTTFCTGGFVKLYANTCSGYTYQWKKDGANITGATSTTYTATVSGSYQLKVTLNGTSAWSALVNVQVNPCRDTETEQIIEEEVEVEDPSTQPLAIQTEEEIPFQMKVFPNPTNGLFTIVLNMPSEINEKITMRIVNMLGQEVYKKEMEGKADYLQETVELDNTLETGIYTLQVVVGNRSENTSVVLAR